MRERDIISILCHMLLVILLYVYYRVPSVISAMFAPLSSNIVVDVLH